MATPRVYVVQETNWDFRLCEEFGEVVFLTHRLDDFYNMRNSPNNERLISHLRHMLREFNPERDWLVWAGSPYVNMAVSVILGEKRVPQLQILRWDNRDLVYIPLVLNFRR